MARGRDDPKLKFRPADNVDREVDAALEGISLDEIYGSAESAKPHAPTESGLRHGRVIAVDPKKDEVFVDFGGKSQGVAAFSQFETEPKVGDELDFHVE